jgi:hypothetical protein
MSSEGLISEALSTRGEEPDMGVRGAQPLGLLHGRYIP